MYLCRQKQLKFTMRKVTLFVFILFSIIAKGQIISIESATISEDSMGLRGIVKLDFYNVKTTRKVLTLNTGSQIQYRWSKHRFFSQNEWKLIKSSTKTGLENRAFQHLRYNYFWKKKVQIEAFGQVLRNPLMKVSQRWQAGTGFKFRIYHKPKIVMHYGLTHMFEHEIELDTAIDHKQSRFSTYLSWKYKPSKKVNLDFIAYYQPIYLDVADFRLTSSLSIRFNFSKHFSFYIAGGILYDSRPPVKLELLYFTYNYKNGIAFNF